MATVPSTDAQTADDAVPPLNDDLAGLLEELVGFDAPGLDQIVNGFRALNTASLTISETQTALVVLTGSSDQPGDQVDIQALLAATVARLLNPDENPALRTLSATVQDQSRSAGADFAEHDAYVTPRNDIGNAVYELDPI